MGDQHMRSITWRVVSGVITLLLLAGLVQLSRDRSGELLPGNRNPDSTIQDGGLLSSVHRAESLWSVDGEAKAQENNEEVGRLGQRQLSVLSGTASAYCGATCADGYSAGSRGNQQCLNELPDAIPRRSLNRLLDQGIRVLDTSEQRRLLMPNMKDPSVSWAYWKVTCFYNDVVVEGPVSVIEEFVDQYRRPVEAVSVQDVDDPFTRLGNAINNFRETFSGQQEKESGSKSESKIAAGPESK